MEEVGGWLSGDENVVAEKRGPGSKKDARKEVIEAKKLRRKEGDEGEWEVVELRPEEREEWEMVEEEL